MPPHRKTLFELSKAVDLALLFLALGLADAVRVGSSPREFFVSLNAPRSIQVFLATLALGAIWHSLLTDAGLYRSHRLTSLSKELAEAAHAILGCTLFAFVWLALNAASPSGGFAAHAAVAALFGLFALVLLAALRIAHKLTMRVLRQRGHNTRNVVIVGSNRRATGFAGRIEAHPEWGYQLLGFVDDTWCCDATSAQLLCSLSGFPALLRTTPVDEVIIALPLASFYRQAAQVIDRCKQHGIVVRSAGALFDFEGASLRVLSEDLGGTIMLYDNSGSASASFLKRLVDLAIASSLLVLLSPLLALIVLLVRITSGGPVLFTQTRLGAGKRPFRIYKFRTMVAGAEKQVPHLAHRSQTGGPAFKLKHDPRITRFGSILRKTSLDELPQLFNVFLGNMSLVGPRPLPLRDYEGFSQDLHRRRFSVKPGITCLWQVMGRSAIGFEEWMALDLRYIDQWSMWLDIKILLRTIPAVLRGSGAI